MPDSVIQEFFQKRREDWLKKETSASMSEEDLSQLQENCAKKFSLENWLPDAAKRAGQISISTHPCTFSHPSARKNKNGYVTSIIATADRIPDGYLRTGNVNVEQDALGNAAALDVYKFLMLTMADGTPLHQHIKSNSPLATEALSIRTENYETLRDGFLAMFDGGDDNTTSSKLKQVFYPVDQNYHLLSVLSNSGLIYELRKRVDDLRFSDHQKQLRDKKRNNEYSEIGFSEIYEITTIGYGGTKPQNVSVLNNQFGGKARLLLSSPPTIAKRSVQFPRDNFFTNSIRFYDIHKILKKLHRIFQIGSDSVIPRKNLETGRDDLIEEIREEVILRMVAVRAVMPEQYREESTKLSHHQKIWLCNHFETERALTDDWLDDLCEEITQWIMTAYKKTIKQAITLGPAERAYIRQMVETHKEALR